MLKIGIVGLPNVGKSTLFKVLTKKQIDIANYPFCTIEPNIGCLEVPDPRLAKLTEISKSEKTVPAMIEFADIAGLVKGASKGEGLGNKFLSHIREVEAIAHMVRVFEDKNVTHVHGQINPKEDIEVINYELIMADKQTLDNFLERNQKAIKGKTDKEILKKAEVFEKIKLHLDKGELASKADLTEDEKELIKEYNLLTLKPVIYILNVTPEQLNQEIDLGLDLSKEKVIKLALQIEAEVSEMPKQEADEFLKEFGLQQSSTDLLIKTGFDLLGLITFFTSGEKESRAWPISRGLLAPQAAGKIHSDFEKGYISADIIKYNDFIINNGWKGCPEKGLIKNVGKDYEVGDGDVVLFKFNV